MTRVALIRTLLVSLVFLLPFALAANEGGNFIENDTSRKHVVIIVGAAVDEARSQTFGRWAFTLRELLKNDYGYAADQVELLIGDGNGDGVAGSSRIESIRERFEALATSIRPSDQLTVILIGHGTGRADMAKFNIVGPDITGPEFAGLLDAISTQNIVVINTTSASYDFSKALSASGRVVVSATRSAAEKYDTVFADYFVEGLQNRAADRDKNGRISVLEAFSFARAGVENYFKERGTLPTENAVLDDSGDGVFSERSHANGDGGLAEIAYLDFAAGKQHRLSPAARQLTTRMNSLEREVIALRGNKTRFGEGEYWTQLESLLVELAKVTREFDGLSQR